MLTELNAISPIDGRYRSKTAPLANYFSEEALIKYRVLVEVEYFIALCELPLPQLQNVQKDLFPELRIHVPIFHEAESDDNFSDNFILNYTHHIESIEKNELTNKGLDEIYYTNLTTIDIKQLGFEVVKVITPKLSLLTGNFNYPYLGLFDENIELFTKFPHPFP